MRQLYAVFFVLWLSSTGSLFAQCPPPGFPQPGNTCVQAPILCENLDGYCATINNSNSVQPFPGCGGLYVLNNDEWFAFFAGTTSITIEVTPSNCSQGGNMGLQGGIYQGCGGPVMDVQCACTENPFILTSNNFIVGQIYWMVLDGCGGNVCDYSISVLSGSTVGVPPSPPGPITGNVEPCQGSSYPYSISPVTGATSYTWSVTPAGAGTASGTGASTSISWAAGYSGPAEICVIANNACYSNTTPSCYMVEVIPRPTAMLSGSGILCTGGTPTPVNMTVTFTGTGPWNFVYTINGVPQPPIQTSDNPYTLPVSMPGIIGLSSVSSVTGSCTGTVSGTGTVSPISISATSTTTPSICEEMNGSINLTPSGGTAPYMFVWSNGETTEDISNIAGPATYTVTVTDNNGCTTVQPVNLGNTQLNFTLTPTIVANTTCMGGNGSITVTPSPAGTYTYMWGTGETINSLTGLAPGSYSVTVSAGGTCTQTATYVVPDQPNPPVIMGTIVPTTCELSNGNVNLSASGGVAPYTFLWDNGETSQNLNNIPAGSYSVTVTGANGCTASLPFNLGNSNPPITVTPTVVANTTCMGGNGSISLSVSPAGSYTYLWGGGETTSSLTNLPPGSYDVTVSAGGACTAAISVNVPDNPNTPSITYSAQQTSCDLSNGTINVSVTGGVAPYTYLWGGGETSQNLTNIPAGNYSLTVTGANGCTTTTDIAITNANPVITINPTVVANTTCNGGNGSISVTVTPPNTYTYTWSTGATTSSITGLTPGSYSLTVSAGGTCTQSIDINVPDQPNTPTATYTTIESTCELANGGINLNVTGGVAPYTFLWSNGTMTQNLNNIPAGSYSVVVTGANGCTTTADVTVGNTNPVFNINPNIVPNTNCNGIGNGAVSLTVTPPGAYTYLWFNGNTTNGLSMLLPGSYGVTVSAGGACSQFINVVIPDEPDEPSLTYSVVDATCGLSNGSINLSVSGAVAPYTYQWSSGPITQDLNNIPPDAYFVTVTAANGCTSVELINVGDNPVNVSISGNVMDNTSCTTTGNGSISITYFPLNATVQWDYNNSTSTTLNNLLPGDYTVTVSAGGTCTETETFTVSDFAEIPELYTDVTPGVCGLPNGSIDLEVDGGTTPYTYNWSTNAATQDIANLAEGDYFVTVTTASGCTNVAVVNMPNNELPISLLAAVFENSSCLFPNGTIYLDVVPEDYTYMYHWSNNSLTANQSGLAAGTYTVTVTLGSCTAIEAFDVPLNALPPNLAVAGTAASCGVSNGSAVATASGGQSPYTYKWSNTTMSATANNLAPGVYTVTVTGANGCSASASVTIPNNTISIDVTGNITPNTSCVSGNGGIDITVAPAGNAYSYLWSNAATTEDLSNLMEGTYTLTVSLGTTCSGEATFIVTKVTADPVITPAVTAAICGQSNGAIDISISGAAGPFMYIWSNAEVTEDLNNIFAGNYTVTVTATNGCTATASMNVANNSSTFSLSGTAAPLTTCGANNGAVDLVITPAGPYQTDWSNMATTEDLSGLAAGTYTVTVTQSGSCTASASFVVADQTSFPMLTRTVTAEVCGLSNGAINLSVSGGATPYTYLWSNAAVTEDLTNIPGGVYTVTVTGANGCSATLSATVANNSITFSVDGVTAPNTSCATLNGGIDITVTPPGTYTYLWSNMEVTEDLTGINGGSYTVTVSAGGTCTADASFTVIDNTLSPTITEVITPALCSQSNGGINVSVTGSTTPYTYIWSNAEVTEDISNLPGGMYTVTVTGANGCSTVKTITIPNNTFSPSISGAPTANTSCTTPGGAVTVGVTPVGNSYTYLWSVPGTTNTISGLAAGMYTVTVSAGGACTAVSSFTVVNNTQSPNIDGTITPSLCSQPNGGIDITVTGATAPYTYTWSDNSTNEDLTNLLAGDYTVTVTAANGCTETATFTVDNDSNNFDIAGAITTQTSCLAPNGAVAVTMIPLGVYTYVWSNGPLSEDVTGLAAGIYTVTVTDDTGCAISKSFTIVNNIVPVAISGVTTDILCFGGNTGAIDVTVDTGTPAYTYTWGPAQPGNPQDLNAVPAGIYALTVTDTKGCSATAVYQVNQPASGILVDCDQSKTVSMPGALDGEGTVSISGGTAPYTVDWSPGSTATGVNAGPFVITNLAEGSYGITVTDANGCKVNCGFNIGLVDCTTEIGTMSSQTIAKCGNECITASYSNIGQVLDPEDVLQFILHEGNNNQIINEFARNSQPSFCYDPATMNFGTTYYISAVAGNDDGMGNVILTDFCTVVSFGTPIIFNENPEASIVPPADLNCVTDAVVLTGSSTLPATIFQWSTTGTISGNTDQAMVTATAGGNYQMIVSANGCKDTASVVVSDYTNSPQAIVSADPTDVLDCTLDQIILSGEVEGSNNANIIWMANGAIYATGNTVPVTEPGTYLFIVLDTLSLCSDTASITINQNQAYPPLFVNPPDQLTCEKTSVTLSGGSPFTGIGFRWVTISGTDTTIISNASTVTVTLPGVYFLVGYDPANTCTNIESITVLSNQNYPIADAGTPFNIDCYGETLPLSGSASNGTNLQIQWSTTNGNLLSGQETFTPLITLPGTYQLVVTNIDNGCSASDEVVIPPDAPVADLEVTQPPCYGDRGKIEIKGVTGGAPPVSYSLNGEPFTTQTVFGGLPEGVYTLIVSDAQGCTTTIGAVIDEPEEFLLTLTPETTIKIGDSYIIEVESSVPPSEISSIQWTPSTGLSCDTCLSTIATPYRNAQYEINASNNAGCKDRAVIIIRVDTRLDIYAPNIITPDGTDGNNMFTIFTDPERQLKIRSLQIFSRWGEKVFIRENFEPNDPSLGWDGTFDGIKLNPAVFVWYAIIIGPDGNEFLIEGDVTVSR